MPGVRTTIFLILAAVVLAVTVGAALARQGRDRPGSGPTDVGGSQPATTIRPAASGGLSLPIACAPGVDCEVQNYVDRDATQGVSDFRCGTRTYDGHNGIDFRLRDLAAQRLGVDVLAAQDGVVTGVRNHVPDVSVAQAGPASVAGQECGNGVVVEHADGLTTQYCHLARGSVSVRVGDQVQVGDALGRVGLSGLTEYPHLHFTVRRDGAVVDPFQPSTSASCVSEASLWTAGTAAQLDYKERVVLNTGFAASPVTMESVEGGAIAPPDRSAPALVAFVRVLGVKRGDIQSLVLTAPWGEVVAETLSDPVPRDQAQRLLFVGGRRNGDWPAGAYVATYRIRSGGAVVLEKRFDLVL